MGVALVQGDRGGRVYMVHVWRESWCGGSGGGMFKSLWRGGPGFVRLGGGVGGRFERG